MKYLHFFLISFFLLFNCSSDDDCQLSSEQNLCPTENLGIGIENQDPFYSIPTPNPFLTATHRWLWRNNDENLKLFSKGEVSDDAVEYSVFEFSFNENGCLTPVLFSNFILETELILNTITNEYETVNNIFNYSEDTFTIKVEEYKENEILKARVIYNNNPNLSKNIFAELVTDNNIEIPN